MKDDGVEPPHLAELTEQDRAGFADLVNGIHREYGFAFDARLDADLANPEAFYRRVWILKHDDAVVGSVALTPPDQGATTLKRMYLRSAYRGQGWGRQLLSTAIAAATSWSCQAIRLDTSDRQHAARRLYESAGFQLEDQTDGTRYYLKRL